MDARRSGEAYSEKIAREIGRIDEKYGGLCGGRDQREMIMQLTPLVFSSSQVATPSPRS
jgi:hypothetical protein